jgi:hypothetical protein
MVDLYVFAKRVLSARCWSLAKDPVGGLGLAGGRRYLREERSHGVAGAFGEEGGLWVRGWVVVVGVEVEVAVGGCRRASGEVVCFGMA